MRIWCFTCFGEKEEDCTSSTKEMSEGILGNVIDGGGEAAPSAAAAGGGGGNDDMENDESEGFGLGLHSWGGTGAGVVAGGANGDGGGGLSDGGNGDLENEGFFEVVNWRHFDQLEKDSCKKGIKEVNLQLGLSDEPSSSSALFSAALDRENCDRDSHNKRPKVQSFSLDWGTHFDNEVSYLPLMCKDGSVDYKPDSGGTIDDEGNDSSTSKAEDLEARMDLTDDLLHMVFSFLDDINLCRASRVCRQWRAASSHEDFWRRLNFENRPISPAQFEDMCQRYPNATDVNIYGTPSIHLLVMRAVSSLRNLEKLTLGKGQIAENFFQALPECHMLKTLAISDTALGNGIQEIPIYHDHLHTLEIVKCRVLRVAIRCPQLQKLSLQRSSMPHAVLNCPLLRELNIASCHKLSDAAIRSAATSCPLLESLDMSNCSCVSDDTLREIALTCENLHILNASYCPNISLESVRLPMLTILKLHSCEGITSASMAAIAHSYMLEVLQLDNCSLLTSVSLDLPRLKNISLVHCRKFIDLNLRSSMLSLITVSNCPSLQRINITSNTLKKLVLQKQESLTSLALQCQSLQEVDLTECESLTNSICDVFSDGGGCPLLKSLILDNCESLTKVGFCSSSLVTLSLAGCRAITSLELKCPHLEQVSLDGCDHLEKASFCPVGLRSLNLGICPKLNVLNVEAPQMALLELKGCGVLSEASIKCPLLTSLDASFCSQLKDDCLSATTASCPLIESLVLMSCTSVGLDGLLSLHLLPNLTCLDLSYTFLDNLLPVFESCSHLKVLKLQACKYLADSSLKPLYNEVARALPALYELDLSYGTLSWLAIEELLACCTHLTHVNLSGCVNMHDLDWGFGGNEILEQPRPDGLSDENKQPHRLLQYLDCVGCPNIKKVAIPPTAQCHYLSSLNLSLSTNLKEIDVACCNLRILNLSNCISLETLKLDCPRLTSLSLLSCNIDEEALEAVMSCCSMLETLDVRCCPKIRMSVEQLHAAYPSLKRIY
ncbi:F-box/LRR-repeat protein 15 [Coffea arabica]|uniref:F-box/LRR-repeat protein 15 n=1 Tax=Coffea arabica TaxID=13443 RepID=A0A6P6TRX3_COFAR